MKESNIIQEKSYQFALKLISFLRSTPRNFVTMRLTDQVLRIGTSIGANVEEAIGAFSKEDFVYKMNTALKETRETNFWLRLLRDSRLSDPAKVSELAKESEELLKILTSIVKSSRGRS